MPTLFAYRTSTAPTAETFYFSKTFVPRASRCTLFWIIIEKMRKNIIYFKIQGNQNLTLKLFSRKNKRHFVFERICKNCYVFGKSCVGVTCLISCFVDYCVNFNHFLVTKLLFPFTMKNIMKTIS